MDFLVTFAYEPGGNVVYYVKNAPTVQDAKNAALHHNGYNPGCDIRVAEVKMSTKIQDVLAAKYIVDYAALTTDDLNQIRFND
jgi:hypothetical protein